MTHPGLLDAMLNPAFYPGPPGEVKLEQTHASLVFLAGDLVYKVKKAVDFGFLDFSTLEKRAWYCREEIRLNRRLAPEVYLEAVEIREDEEGALHLGGDGKIVEYAVKMRRLPKEKMLKVILKGDFDRSLPGKLAEKIASFHKEAKTGGKIDEIGSLATIHRNHEENFRQTEGYIGVTIPRGQYDFIKDCAFDFLKRQEGLFNRRVREHRIRECHGDLHLEHICLDDGISIFDCIEFNERFRFADVAAEVAFLAMDLDLNGHEPLAEDFVRAYVACTDDRDLLKLLNFYKCYYAYVRGKVVSFRLDDRGITGEERREAGLAARRYFDLALAYATRPDVPLLIITAGLMGTGKSSLASRLAPLLGAEVVSSDVERKRLLNLDAAERRLDLYGEGIYTESITEETYDYLLEKAGELIARGKSVIIDASYRKSSHRLAAAARAAALGAGFLVIETTCGEGLIKERLDKRIDKTGEPSDGRWELIDAQKRDFEQITGIPADRHVLADTGRDEEDYLYDLLRRIKGLGGQADGKLPG